MGRGCWLCPRFSSSSSSPPLLLALSSPSFSPPSFLLPSSLCSSSPPLSSSSSSLFLPPSRHCESPGSARFLTCQQACEFLSFPSLPSTSPLLSSLSRSKERPSFSSPSSSSSLSHTHSGDEGEESQSKQSSSRKRRKIRYSPCSFPSTSITCAASANHTQEKPPIVFSKSLLSSFPPPALPPSSFSFSSPPVTLSYKENPRMRYEARFLSTEGSCLKRRKRRKNRFLDHGQSYTPSRLLSDRKTGEKRRILSYISSSSPLHDKSRRSSSFLLYRHGASLSSYPFLSPPQLSSLLTFASPSCLPSRLTSNVSSSSSLTSSLSSSSSSSSAFLSSCSRPHRFSVEVSLPFFSSPVLSKCFSRPSSVMKNLYQSYIPHLSPPDGRSLLLSESFFSSHLSSLCTLSSLELIEQEKRVPTTKRKGEDGEKAKYKDEEKKRKQKTEGEEHEEEKKKKMKMKTTEKEKEKEDENDSKGIEKKEKKPILNGVGKIPPFNSSSSSFATPALGGGSSAFLINEKAGGGSREGKVRRCVWNSSSFTEKGLWRAAPVSARKFLRPSSSSSSLSSSSSPPPAGGFLQSERTPGKTAVLSLRAKARQEGERREETEGGEGRVRIDEGEGRRTYLSSKSRASREDEGVSSLVNGQAWNTYRKTTKGRTSWDRAKKEEEEREESPSTSSPSPVSCEKVSSSSSLSSSDAFKKKRFAYQWTKPKGEPQNTHASSSCSSSSSFARPATATASLRGRSRPFLGGNLSSHSPSSSSSSLSCCSSASSSDALRSSLSPFKSKSLSSGERKSTHASLCVSKASSSSPSSSPSPSSSSSSIRRSWTRRWSQPVPLEGEEEHRQSFSPSFSPPSHYRSSSSLYPGRKSFGRQRDRREEKEEEEEHERKLFLEKIEERRLSLTPEEQNLLQEQFDRQVASLLSKAYLKACKHEERVAAYYEALRPPSHLEKHKEEKKKKKKENKEFNEEGGKEDKSLGMKENLESERRTLQSSKRMAMNAGGKKEVEESEEEKNNEEDAQKTPLKSGSSLKGHDNLGSPSSSDTFHSSSSSQETSVSLSDSSPFQISRSSPLTQKHTEGAMSLSGDRTSSFPCVLPFNIPLARALLELSQQRSLDSQLLKSLEQQRKDSSQPSSSSLFKTDFTSHDYAHALSLKESGKTSIGFFFSSQSYRKASELIQEACIPIRSSAECLVLLRIAGGRKMANEEKHFLSSRGTYSSSVLCAVEEFLSTGRIKEVEERKEQVRQRALTVLQTLPCIGKKTAETLVDLYHIDSIETLRNRLAKELEEKKDTQEKDPSSSSSVSSSSSLSLCSLLSTRRQQVIILYGERLHAPMQPAEFITWQRKLVDAVNHSSLDSLVFPIVPSQSSSSFSSKEISPDRHSEESMERTSQENTKGKEEEEKDTDSGQGEVFYTVNPVGAVGGGLFTNQFSSSSSLNLASLSSSSSSSFPSQWNSKGAGTSPHARELDVILSMIPDPLPNTLVSSSSSSSSPSLSQKMIWNDRERRRLQEGFEERKKALLEQYIHVLSSQYQLVEEILSLKAQAGVAVLLVKLPWNRITRRQLRIRVVSPETLPFASLSTRSSIGTFKEIQNYVGKKFACLLSSSCLTSLSSSSSSKGKEKNSSSSSMRKEEKCKGEKRDAVDDEEEDEERERRSEEEQEDEEREQRKKRGQGKEKTRKKKKTRGDVEEKDSHMNHDGSGKNDVKYLTGEGFEEHIRTSGVYTEDQLLEVLHLPVPLSLGQRLVGLSFKGYISTHFSADDLQHSQRLQASSRSSSTSSSRFKK